MSNALGIAAVTAVLKDLLNNGVIAHDLTGVVGQVTVSALPPDRIVPSSGGTQPSQLNIFLYQVLPNTGWATVNLPSRNGSGDRVSNPPLALNLRYLLTAYGANDFDAEILLGYAMQLLHETPGLSRDAIRAALSPPSPVGGGSLPPPFAALSAADLADQFEQLKISPLFVDTEEMYRLWSAMQAHYRPSMTYEVTVVLIESKRPTRAAPPVRRYHVDTVPFRQPAIEQVRSQTGPGTPILTNAPILFGQRLVLDGQQLRGAHTRVRLGNLPTLQEPASADIANDRVMLTIPPELRAGIQGVQIVHPIATGEPPEFRPGVGVESNVAAFVLRPTIARRGDGTDDITLTDLQTAADGTRSATVSVKLTPLVAQGQRLVLLLNEIGAPITRPPRAYTFRDPAWTAPGDVSDTIAFVVNGVVPGAYLVRVQIDGAESPLTSTTDATAYSRPAVTI
jgi:hypothetical protein